jgi:hypothetical protein
MIGGTFITRAALELNGKVFDDFSSVEEHAIVAGKKVPLMYGSGWAPKTKRFELTVEYVVPTVNAIDWLTVKNATFTIDYENGERVSYGGVNILDVGNAKADGETEVKKAIQLSANSRNGDFGA